MIGRCIHSAVVSRDVIDVIVGRYIKAGTQACE